LGYGEVRRKNWWVFVAGLVTEMKPLFVERAATTEDQAFETEMFVFD
jgi:hypothetical protein